MSPGASPRSRPCKWRRRHGTPNTHHRSCNGTPAGSAAISSSRSAPLLVRDGAGSAGPQTFGSLKAVAAPDRTRVSRQRLALLPRRHDRRHDTGARRRENARCAATRRRRTQERGETVSSLGLTGRCVGGPVE